MILGGYVWRFVDEQALVRMLAGVSWTWLAAAYAVFIGYQWVKGLRIRLLAGIGDPAAPLFFTQCIHAVLNNLLPSGLGELAFVYLLKRLHGVKYHFGTVAVVIGRILDLSVFSLLFLILIVLMRRELPFAVVLVMSAVAGVGLGAIAVLMMASRSMRRMQKFTQRHSERLAHHVNQIGHALEITRSAGGYSTVLVYSILMWALMYLFFVFVVYALNAPLSPLTVLWVYLLAFPVNILPIKGVANVGTHEAVWFIALRLVDVEADVAAAVSFGSHALFLVVVGLTGVIPWLAYISGTLQAHGQRG